MSRAHDLATALLRRLAPETAHGLALAALAWGLGPKARGAADPILATRIAGLEIASPLGLAAGFDKDARVPDAMLAAGFGFVECGTVTPLPQTGNPQPRLFRLPEDLAVINRMGFNNVGHAAFEANLAGRRGRSSGPVGVNIGAGKDSPDRVGDYVLGLRRFWPRADYFTLNISSPNTPGLRDLQGRGRLDDLLAAVAEAREALAAQGRTRPLFVKIAPDLGETEARDIVEAALARGIDGLIVGNTTTGRPAGLAGRHRGEAGGLSGAPLFAASTGLLALVRRIAGRRLTLIGVGGVGTGAQAYAKIRAGADAVQLYTALAYAGPGLVRRLNLELAARLRADGFASVAEAVGEG